MSPGKGTYARPRDRFPRASGDEPVQSTSVRLTILFSPRERG